MLTKKNTIKSILDVMAFMVALRFIMQLLPHNIQAELLFPLLFAGKVQLQPVATHQLPSESRTSPVVCVGDFCFVILYWFYFVSVFL